MYETTHAHKRETTSRPRLLVLTPYSPLLTHRHAADDIAKHLAEALTDYFDLHIYAPGQKSHRSAGITFHEGASPRISGTRHFGLYPAGLRKDWSRKNSREAVSLINTLKPDYVHFEYAQPAEAAFKWGGSWTATLHDNSGLVYKQRTESESGIRKLYRVLEQRRIELVEARVLRKARHIFVLSTRDKSWAQSTAKHVTPLKLSISTNGPLWTPDPQRPPTVLFAGAMWRDVNAAAAHMIMSQVMPLVWQRVPEARLRIVGAKPPPWLRELADGVRVDIVGEVQSLDVEYLSASLVLAPSTVDAGILMKALRALSLGCILVTNKAGADPIHLQDDKNAFVKNEPESIAAIVADILMDDTHARAVAAQGKRLFDENYSWQTYARSMMEGIKAHA